MLLALKIRIYQEVKITDPDNFITIQKNLHKWGYQDNFITSFLQLFVVTPFKHIQVGYQNE